MGGKPGSKATHLPWRRTKKMALRLKEMQPQDILCSAVFLFFVQCGVEGPETPLGIVEI